MPVLEALQNAGHEIAAVYCQPPRPAGRGKKDRLTPVHARALELGLEVRHPVNFKSEADVAAFSAVQADVAVVVAYGLILPPAILTAPARGCLNIHASLLPRWRGAAPIHRAILAGDKLTGICIMQMDAGLDTGRVLLRREIPIEADTTTGRLHDSLSALGADAIVEALTRLPDLVAEDQAEDGVTYAAKIDKSEARVDWTLSAAEVDRHIRGLSPFPGAWCEFKGERLKLLECSLADGVGAPGEILDAALTIACGQGAVQLLRLQRSGKGAMDVETFLRGFDLPVGARLN